MLGLSVTEKKNILFKQKLVAYHTIYKLSTLFAVAGVKYWRLLLYLHYSPYRGVPVQEFESMQKKSKLRAVSLASLLEPFE